MAVHSAVLKGRKEMADISHAETVSVVLQSGSLQVAYSLAA